MARQTDRIEQGVCRAQISRGAQVRYAVYSPVGGGRGKFIVKLVDTPMQWFDVVALVSGDEKKWGALSPWLRRYAYMFELDFLQSGLDIITASCNLHESE